MDLDIVVITGAGRGIGRAIALDIGKDTPVLCISQSSKAQETADEINSNGGKAEALSLDISDYNLAKQVIGDWLSSKPYKKIGMVLAAAILGPTGPHSESFLKEWELTHKINVLGNMAIYQALYPRMEENKFGRIVFFSGGGAAYANPAFPAYASTKTATVRIVENISEELKGKGDFSIVALAPGAIKTDMLNKFETEGGKVLNVVDISEPISFVREFVYSESCSFSGSLVHVRNNWKDYLNTDKELSDESYWKLRRIE